MMSSDILSLLRGLNGLNDFQVTLDISIIFYHIFIKRSSQQPVNTPTSAIFKSFPNLSSSLFKNSFSVRKKQFETMQPVNHSACAIRYRDRCCQRQVNAQPLN